MKDYWTLEDIIVNGRYELQIFENKSATQPKSRIILKKKYVGNLEKTILEQDYKLNNKTGYYSLEFQYLKDLMKEGYVSTKEFLETYHQEDVNGNNVNVIISKLNKKIDKIIKNRRGIRDNFGYGSGFYIGDLARHRKEFLIKHNNLELNVLTGYIRTPRGKKINMNDNIPFRILQAIIENNGSMKRESLKYLISPEDNLIKNNTLHVQINNLNKQLGREYIRALYLDRQNPRYKFDPNA